MTWGNDEFLNDEVFGATRATTLARIPSSAFPIPYLPDFRSPTSSRPSSLPLIRSNLPTRLYSWRAGVRKMSQQTVLGTTTGPKMCLLRTQMSPKCVVFGHLGHNGTRGIRTYVKPRTQSPRRLIHPKFFSAGGLQTLAMYNGGTRHASES